jgi:hypothetical protein
MTAISKVPVKPLTKSEEFTLYLKRNISTLDFIKLHSYLGRQTTNRLTRLLNPIENKLGQFEASEILVVAQLLNVPPSELVEKWGLGLDALSVNQMNQMIQPEGLQLGFVTSNF